MPELNRAMALGGSAIQQGQQNWQATYPKTTTIPTCSDSNSNERFKQAEASP
jgi:hypothetical protein